MEASLENVAGAQVVEIRPTSGWRAIDYREIWAFRELLYILAWRDLKVRYRQTLLGAAWVIGQPLVAIAIFTFVFNRVAKIQSGTSVPYPVFILAGLLLWNFFSSIVDRAGNSLLGASYLISKVYFPRLLIPLSAVLVALVDLAVSALLLVPFLIWYRTPLSIWALAAPLAIVVCAIFSLGLGLWVAALNVEYRDIRVLIPFVLQIGLYVTPVVYPLSAIPERYRSLAYLNPMTGILEAFRVALFGGRVTTLTIVSPLVFALLFFVSGAFYFRRMERQFADIL